MAADNKSKYKRQFGYKFSNFGSNGYGHDVKAFGDTAGKYFMWDASADTFYVVGNSSFTGNLNLDGTFNADDIVLADNETLTFGTGNDVVLTWNGTKLTVTGATDGALIELDKVELSTRKKTEIFDDFLYQTLTEANTPWVLNSGSDAEAIDPAINAQEGGVVRLTTGDADGTVAADGSQLVCHIPMNANNGGMVFETRLRINTAITEVSVNAGFTDSKTLEEPFSNSADTITSVASNAACFVYDDGATTKEWFAAAVEGDTDDTGNGASGSAPVADTYQVLRIEISADDSTIKFFINGTLVKTLSGGGVSATADLYATIVACATTTTSKTVDVDYIYCGTTK